MKQSSLPIVPRVSIIILSQDKEANIAACLDSVTGFDSGRAAPQPVRHFVGRYLKQRGGCS